MDINQLSDKALRHEIYAVRRELREDLKQVREIAKNQPHFPRYSLQHMSKLEKQMRDVAVRDMSTTQLRTLYRDLNYIKSLKSSSVKGVTSMSFALEPIKEDLKTFSKTKQKEFWDMYGRLYQVYSESSRFKYEIIPLAFEYFQQGGKIDNITDKFETLLRETIKSSGGGFANNETFRLRFTEGLRDIFKVK